MSSTEVLEENLTQVNPHKALTFTCEEGPALQNVGKAEDIPPKCPGPVSGLH